MDTQARVLAMLNKVQTVRKVNKEKLGAISDVVAEAKNGLETQASIFNDEANDVWETWGELYDYISVVTAKLDKAVDNLPSDSDIEKWEKTSEELESYNSNVGNDEFLMVESAKYAKEKGAELQKLLNDFYNDIPSINF